jgi:hypothetical protein
MSERLPTTFFVTPEKRCEYLLRAIAMQYQQPLSMSSTIPTVRRMV